MSAEKKKQRGVLALVVALVVVLLGGVLFVGAVSGWFSGDMKVALDSEYYCGEECSGEMTELDGLAYEELLKAGKSFVVFVDQGGCTTADRLRGYVVEWAKAAGIQVYKMMFSEVRETSLHEYVKYYPSLAVVSAGRPVAWLRADSDEDADAYNDYDAFTNWIDGYIVEKLEK